MNCLNVFLENIISIDEIDYGIEKKFLRQDLKDKLKRL
jgi:hypothetical protein